MVRPICNFAKYLLAASFFAGSALAADANIPELNDYVLDQAGIFSQSEKQALVERLRDYEEKTTNQVVVAIIPVVPGGGKMEDYTLRAANAWRIGQKGKDNGVVLFVFPEEQQTRIEVGTGVEALVTDEIAVEIIEKGMIPAFREGDLAGGVRKGVDGILAALQGKRIFANGGTKGVGPFLAFLLFAIFALLRKVFPTKSSSSGEGGFSGGGGSFRGGGGSGRW